MVILRGQVQDVALEFYQGMYENGDDYGDFCVSQDINASGYGDSYVSNRCDGSGLPSLLNAYHLDNML